MQNVSGETFDAVSVRKTLSKLSDFQSVTASPYRVLHQAQGDKQEINPIRLKSSSKTNGSTQQNCFFKCTGLMDVTRLSPCRRNSRKSQKSIAKNWKIRSDWEQKRSNKSSPI